MIHWLNDNQGFVMAVLTFIYVVATILILIANSRSVMEMKRAREEEVRPYVIAHLERDENVRGALNFVIQNVGKTSAKDIKIMISPTIEKPDFRPLSKSVIITNGIPIMPPNFKIKTFVDMSFNFTDENEGMKVFRFVVRYKGSDNAEYVDEFVSDISVLSEVVTIGVKNFDEFARDFESFSKEYTNSMYALNQNLHEIFSKEK